MSVIAFDEASRIERVAEDRFRWLVPDGWQQGRGTFGGLVLGTLLRAIEDFEASGGVRVPRTLLGDLTGPIIPGEAEITVTVLRRGSNQSNLRAEVRQPATANSSAVLASATALLSAPRPPGMPTHRPRVVSPTPFDSAAPLALDTAVVPIFTRHYEYRPTGVAPFTKGPEPVVAGWVRGRSAPARADAPMLIGLLDSFWPAYYSVTTAWRPMATVSFTAEIACDPTRLDPAAAYFYQARTIFEHDGFQLEEREVYDAHGEILALNQQTFAILK